MVNVHVVHVFVDENGNFGDVATVIFDEGRKIPDNRREEIAQTLDSIETAFVNDSTSRHVGFVHARGEIDFAGVPALGVAWLLEQRTGGPIGHIQGRGGEMTTRYEAGRTWVRASLDSMPLWNHVQLADANSVDRISGAETSHWNHTMTWAWENETEGIIRARTFAPDWNIPEAQGNGSGSMMLASMVNRPIRVRHGTGSEICARPAGSGFADIGGRISEGNSLTI